MNWRAGVVALCATVFLSVTGTSVAMVTTTSDGREGLETYRAIAEKVAKHGWACVYVAGSKQEGNFAYSVGLSGKGQPEVLLVSGDDYNAACTMINLVAKAILARSSPIRDGDAPVAKMSRDVRVRSIYADELYAKCLAAARWRDEHGVKDATGMQIVLADKNGRFPD